MRTFVAGLIKKNWMRNEKDWIDSLPEVDDQRMFEVIHQSIARL
jgi:hypothetical protein